MPLPTFGGLPDSRRGERPGHGPAATENSISLFLGDTGDLRGGWRDRVVSSPLRRLLVSTEG